MWYRYVFCLPVNKSQHISMSASNMFWIDTFDRGLVVMNVIYQVVDLWTESFICQKMPKPRCQHDWVDDGHLSCCPWSDNHGCILIDYCRNGISSGSYWSWKKLENHGIPRHNLGVEIVENQFWSWLNFPFIIQCDVNGSFFNRINRGLTSVSIG
jgi:hypothetical protein